MSSTKFVLFGPISKQKCPPWPIPNKGGTLYSGARYVAIWASCFFFFRYDAASPNDAVLKVTISGLPLSVDDSTVMELIGKYVRCHNKK